MSRPLAYAVSCLIAGACQTSSHARYHYLEQEREAFVFRVPRAAVVAEVDRIFADEGFTVVPHDADAGLIETEWQEEAHGNRQRFTARLIPLARGGLLVHIVGVSKDEHGRVYHRARWDELEWELIQRVEPDRAVEILSRANERSDEVHRRGH